MASMPAQRLALLALLLLAAAWRCVADDHDCIFGSPPECANSLAGDKACRGATATNNTAWISMDCDCERWQPAHGWLFPLGCT